MALTGTGGPLAEQNRHAPAAVAPIVFPSGNRRPNGRIVDGPEWPQDPEDAPPPRDDGYTSPVILRMSLWSIEDILARASPKWLLEHLFALGALVVVYGAPGCAKSFLVLDWALSIAAGRSWLDYEVISPGRVVYVVGEGAGGLRKRVQAWMQEHPQDTIPEAFFIPEPVQLLNKEDVDMLLTRIVRLRPVLVILDTLATCMDGDENSSKDMSLAIAAAKRIIRETGATVILVHHTGKRGDGERGHSTLRGAADTMMLVRAKTDASGGKLVEVVNTKQKDEDACLPITAQLTCVRVGTTDDGEPLTSCVLQATGATPSFSGELGVGVARTLSMLVERFPNGTSSTLWRESLQANDGPPLPKRTYQNHRGELLERGLVELVPGRRDHYRATAEGKALLHPPACEAATVTTMNNSDASDSASAEVCRSSAIGTEPQDGTAPSTECDSRANAVDR
jgi:AAA domain-containing protein